MSRDSMVLLPPPRRVERLQGFADGAALARTEIRIDPAEASSPEGYLLRVAPDRVEIVAHDPAGAFYGRMTLRQLERQRDPTRGVPCLAIEDAPDLRHRGVMLDISRDRVPTMETLFELVDLLSEWKINELQLYIEHTFAYARHREVWEHASPLTPEEIRTLDAYCRERFVELVPNQNSFGHMERWLRLPRYLPLAEAPDGFEDPWGNRHDGPHSLCPTDPRTLDLLRELYDELLPNFTSGRFNVGLDETWDLGQGRSRAASEERGVGRVYLEFLQAVHREVEKRGKEMLFWGDIILKHPELIAELPRDVTALDWGYEGDHPFAEECAKFADAGVPFYVCPGTSTWNSIAGRTTNAIVNIRNAAENGLAHGAVGLLVTDWGDNGHWQPLPVSFLGYALGAATAWSGRSGADLDLERALDLHAFHDGAGVAAGVALDLGNAYTDTGVELKNATVLARLLLFPERRMDHANFANLTIEGLDRAEARVENAALRIARARMARSDGSLVVEELRLVAAMLRHACRLGRARLGSRGGMIAAIPREETLDLAADLEAIIGQFRRLWLARSRPGGLGDSVSRLEALLGAYRT